MKKFLLGLALGLPLVAIAVGVIVYLNLNSIVRQGVETIGPRATHSSVTLDSVNLDVFAGKVEIKNLVIGNPQGFRGSAEAMRFPSLRLSLDRSTVMHNPMVVREIVAQAPLVNYERGAHGSNLDAIKANIDHYVKDMSASLGVNAGPQPGKPEQKFIINSIVIKDAQVDLYLPLTSGRTATLRIPDIRQTGLGRAEGGLTASQAASSILTGLVADLGHNLSDPLTEAGRSIGQAFSRAFKGK